MTSRERVLAAVRREKPDRTPSDFRAEKPTLAHLYAYCGHSDYDRLLTDLNVDMRYVDCITPAERDCGDYIENYWGERYIYRKTDWGYYRDDLPGALSKATSLRELEEFDWPRVDRMDFGGVAAQCEKYDDYGIMYGFADIFTRPMIVRGCEQMLVDLYENPEFVHFLVKKFSDYYMDEYTRAFRESGGRIDMFLIMGDLATQLAPLISPGMFDEFVAENLKRINARIHELGAYSMFHTCGQAYQFFDRLIDCGVDVIDPMQRTGPDMFPENLAGKFGGRVCFHGGIDVQTTLPFGTPDEVGEEVHRYIKAFGGNGYICCSAHYMQHDTPPENIIALHKAISES
jgi:uroporphyrinogen decarboxylase